VHKILKKEDPVTTHVSSQLAIKKRPLKQVWLLLKTFWIAVIIDKSKQRHHLWLLLWRLVWILWWLVTAEAKLNAWAFSYSGNCKILWLAMVDGGKMEHFAILELAVKQLKDCFIKFWGEGKSGQTH